MSPSPAATLDHNYPLQLQHLTQRKKGTRPLWSVRLTGCAPSQQQEVSAYSKKAEVVLGRPTVSGCSAAPGHVSVMIQLPGSPARPDRTLTLPTFGGVDELR
jgi:hypothetical protein